MVCYYNHDGQSASNDSVASSPFFAYLTHSLPVWYIWFHDYIDIPSGKECSNKIGS